MPQRARRVAEADRRESRLRLLAREPSPLVGQRRDRREQRPVEQALVQAAHGLLRRLPQLDEVGGVAREPGRAREHAELVVAARHEVGAAQAGELEPVLEQAQEAVVARELRRLLAADVAAVGEGREGAERPRWRIAASVSPWTSCSSWIVNSTSRRPPGPSLSCTSTSPGGMFSVTRSRIRCTDSTKPSRAALDHTLGATPATKRSPSSRSPASGRALSSAWNSQSFAQRS